MVPESGGEGHGAPLPAGPVAGGVRRRTMMETWGPFLLFGGILYGWFALQKWVLPRFGIAT